MRWRESVAGWPLLGGIAYCRWSDFFKALQEIFIKFSIASLPIIISALILRYVGKNHIFFPSALTKNFENGELYLFCTSMLAAIFYIALVDRDEEKPGFPNKLSHLSIVTVMVVLSSVIFALKRAGLYIDPVLLVDASYFFVGICFFMVLLAVTINNGLAGSNAMVLQRRDTSKFVEEFNKRKEGE